mgnify:CR=1 FL=1
MKQTTIKITEIGDIYELVRQANAVDGDVICSRGKYHVDCKSILGLFSLNLTEGFSIEYPEDAIGFENFLRKFM